MASLAGTRTVFLGSPTFALPSLEALTNAGANIIGVVTQPDKPAGRGHHVAAPPVKIWAEKHGLPVFQPKGLKKEENRAFLNDLKPDLLIVVAYGKILPKEVLDLPKFGAVNVHASLLPKYRGPAPIPAAILAGDDETGVTIMKLDEGMDTGPTLAMEHAPIAPDDTTGTLLQKLSDVGARVLVPTLEQYLAGTLSPIPQDNAHATICPMIQKEDGHINWSKPAEHIARMVRAYAPWPQTFTQWNGKRLIIHQARPHSQTDIVASPGQVIHVEKNVAVGTGAGLLVLDKVQIEGGKILSAEEFARGHRAFIGSVLGALR